MEACPYSRKHEGLHVIADALYSRFKSDGLIGKIVRLDWGIIIVVACVAAVGLGLLYSAAGGSWTPWAKGQIFNLLVCIVAMMILSVLNLKFIFRIVPILYIGGLVLLLLVETLGQVGMGAQRWLTIGGFRVQPSEFVKIATVLCLARYYHSMTIEQARRPITICIPLVILLIPTAFVLGQPNLGTAALILIGGASVIWMAGARLWIFVLTLVLLLSSMPIVWGQLHDYQKKRILTFLDPDNDPLGAGYNILQSKIAFGHGGLSGRGFLEGSQSQLRFLPEKHTDFIFTVLGEEFGLIGSLSVIALYSMFLVYGTIVAVTATSHFVRLAAMGLTITIFLYLFTNVAMASGLIPVVGIPLPLISYGGTSALTLCSCIGLLLNFRLNQNVLLQRRSV